MTDEFQSRSSLITRCTLTINDKDSSKDGRLLKLITDELHFKIIGFAPLVIEKDFPTHQDILTIFNASEALCELQESGGQRLKQKDSHNTLAATSDTVVSKVEQTMGEHQKLEIASSRPETEEKAWEQNQFRNSKIDICSNEGMLNTKTLVPEQSINIKEQNQEMKFIEEYVVQCEQSQRSGKTEDFIENVENENKRYETETRQSEFGSPSCNNNISPEQHKYLAVESSNSSAESSKEDQDARTCLLLENMERNDEETTAMSEFMKKDKLDIERNYNLQEKDAPRNETAHGEIKPPLHFQSVKSADDMDSIFSSLTSLLDLESDDCTITHPQVREHGAESITKDSYCVYSNLSQLNVQVYKANISEVKVDCIVNDANTSLEPFWGVAKTISTAAGPALRKECEDFISAGNFVEVTKIFVSTGGDLPAKYVYHAVGPKWHSYEEKNKFKWFDELRRTVLRCLIEANRRRMTSIAFPPISAAIIKVPKDHCARCYMEAVKLFDIFNAGDKGTLQEIHFVDVDDTMVNIIRDCFTQSWAKPSDQEMAEKDCAFVEEHLHLSKNKATNGERIADHENRTFNEGKSTSSPKLLRELAAPILTREPAASAVDAAKKSKTSSFYQFGKVTVYVESKAAFDHAADIIITIGKSFDKLNDVPDFILSSNLKPSESINSEENTYSFFNVCKSPDTQSNLLCEVYPEPNKMDDIIEGFMNLEAAFQSYEAYDSSVQKVILSSSILYAEPTNDQQNKVKMNILDGKRIGKFAQCLYTYLNKISKDRQDDISITVVGSEDALPTIEKVIESYDIKKTFPAGVSYVETGNLPESEREGFGYNKDDYSQKSSAKDSIMLQKLKLPGGGEDYYQASGCNQDNYSERSPAKMSRKVQKFELSRERDVDTCVDTSRVCDFCSESNSCRPVACCNKLLCQDCQQRASVCPFCQKFWKIITGHQPPGTMTVTYTNNHADGYENACAWEIEYNFPSGIQKAYHPSPGKEYNSVRRTAFLPANVEGLQVLILLRLAFIRRLTFKIGHSFSRNKDNTIIWNDVSHKTKLHGGTYGYPDPCYLSQVTLELANKGVTMNNLTDSERHQLENFQHNIINFKKFSDS